MSGQSTEDFQGREMILSDTVNGGYVSMYTCESP